MKLISIEDEIPNDEEREVLVTRLDGVGPRNRRSKIMNFPPDFTDFRIYGDMKAEGFTHWMYVPRVGE